MRYSFCPFRTSFEKNAMIPPVRHRLPAFVSMRYRLVLCAFLLCFLLGGSVEAQRGHQRLRGFTLNPDLTEADYDEMKAWNTNLIRFHLQWDSRADTASREQYLEWLDSALPKLDQALLWCKARGMKVVVNLHTPPGGFKSADYPSLHRLFAEQWALNTFYESWQKITQRYAKNETIWGFDILNEPAIRSPSTAIRSWESIAQATATLIHAIDPERKIIVEPLYGDQARMWSIRNLSFPHLIVSIHYYYPLRFHHQGIYGNPLGVAYPQKNFNRSALLKNLSVINRYQRTKKGKIPIYVGEFTANRWAPNNSAYRYLKDIISIMEKNKWSWTYHAFREADPWNLEVEGEFGVIRKGPGQTKREKLVRGFLARNR